MTEENNTENLRAEIEDLKQRVDQQTTYIGILGLLVIVSVILNWLGDTSGFMYIVLLGCLIILILLMCRMVETRGI